MPGEESLNVTCSCGQVQVTLESEGCRSATRVQCYCIDCQTAAAHLGYELPAHGGSDLIQTTPDRIKIVSGGQNLSIMRLGPKGLCRWFARCCNTPMLNTLPKPGMPFVGIVIHPWDSASADQAVGPIWGHAFTKYAPAGQGAPAEDQHFKGVGARLVARMLGAVLTGRRKINPLRTETGAWIAPAHVLTLEERTAARPG